ncbi:MAG: YtxH domain-containing protein [Candidatus Gastranaerophilales bacterium]|nr:YtxH domain-containing protein [Candidatus Gastranaerophilales bacterium]MCM1072462.1 YtxH domain-containing protein [Bacteroides sp.]
MSKEKSSIGFGIGLLAGVVGGLVAGILYAPCPGEEMRAKVKDTVCDLAEKHSPAIKEAKKQALESVDLLRYKLERQYKKFGNMLKSKKLRRAKELESETHFDW